MPPTSAPLEEPETATTFIPRASSASITPIWAKPRAPPAPSTRAIFSSLRGGASSSAMRSAVVVGQRQRQEPARLLAERSGLDDLRVGAVVQHVHQQLAGVAVGNLQLIAAVAQPAALLLRVPVLVGDPARGALVEHDR